MNEAVIATFDQLGRARTLTRSIPLTVEFDMIRDGNKAKGTASIMVSAVHPGPTLLDAARETLLLPPVVFTQEEAAMIRNVRIVRFGWVQ